MFLNRLPLAAAIVVCAFTNQAWAQYATSPPKPASKAAPAKPAPRVVAPAPAPRVATPVAPPEPQTLVGLRIGAPAGLNAYVMHAIDPNWSLGASAGGFPLSVYGDKFTLFGIAAEGRYHWSGHSPKGGYLFGQLAYLNGKFDHKDNEIEREDANGLYPYAGVGYQTQRSGIVSWDFGIGAGRPVHIKRKTPNNDDDLKIELAAYIGMGFWVSN